MLVLQIFLQFQNINHKLKSFGFFIKEIIGFIKSILFNWFKFFEWSELLKENTSVI